MPTQSASQPISPGWFSRCSTAVAPDLLGCWLVRRFPNGLTVHGLIVETEAYTPDDPAMHAYRRRTKRNEVMFGPAGTTYVYLIYGMYFCLNVVTDRDGSPSAVLIRALKLNSFPAWIDPKKDKPHRVAAGPGKLCRALQIDLSHTAQPLTPEHNLWLEHRTPQFQEQWDGGAIAVVQTTRIGLTQGTDLPWRWYIKECDAVSRK